MLYTERYIKANQVLNIVYKVVTIELHARLDKNMRHENRTSFWNSFHQSFTTQCYNYRVDQKHRTFKILRHTTNQF